MIPIIEPQDLDRCRWVQRLLDDFHNGQLSVETGHQILMHLEECSKCSEAAETIRRNRQLVVRAWHSQSIPDFLRRRIRSQLKLKRLRPGWLSLAAGVLLVVGISGVVMVSGRFPNLWNGGERESSLQQDRTRAILETHLNCRGAGWLPQEALPLQLASLDQALEEYEVLTAHRCRFGEEGLFHFALAARGAVFSLILQEKQVPGLDQNGLREATLVSVGNHVGQWVEEQNTSLVWLDSPRFHIYVVGATAQSNQLLQLVERLMTPLEPLWA